MERDVCGGNREHGQAVAPDDVQFLAHLGEDRIHIRRVAPKQQRHDGGAGQRSNRLRAEVAERLAPTDKASIGLKPQKDKIEGGPFRVKEALAPAPVFKRNAQLDDIGFGDLHAHCPVLVCGAAVRPPSAPFRPRIADRRRGRKTPRQCGHAAGRWPR